jgi:hypothetical protein
VSNVQDQQNKTPSFAAKSPSAKIVCHRCKGMGHVMKDCPSLRAFIAAPDGDRYVSASDVEDDLVVSANYVAGSEEDAIDSITASAGFLSLLVQRALSVQEEHEDTMKA